EIFKSCGDHMNDARFLLQYSMHCDVARAQNNGPEALERLWPDNNIGNSGFILDGHEDDAICRSRPLPDGHEAGHGNTLARAARAQLLIGNDLSARKVAAEKRGRVRAQRELQSAIILYDLFAKAHLRQSDSGLALHRNAGFVPM